MAKEDDLDLDMEGGAEAPKSKSKLLIIILAVVVLLGASTAATLVLTGVLDDEDVAAEDSQSDSKAAKKGKDKKDKKAKKVKLPMNYIPLDPPFVVNFNGDTDIRFLQVTIEMGTRNPDKVESVKEQRPAIRNALVMLFSNQDPYVLNTREGKEALRDQTLAEIQKVMKDETGEPVVESVFFTSFVMQ